MSVYLFHPCDFRLLMPVVSLTKIYNIDSNNSYCFIHVCLYILVDEYEGLPEELHLQIKCFPYLLILKEDFSPSQLSVIQTYHLHCVLLFI